MDIQPPISKTSKIFVYFLLAIGVLLFALMLILIGFAIMMTGGPSGEDVGSAFLGVSFYIVASFLIAAPSFCFAWFLLKRNVMSFILSLIFLLPPLILAKYYVVCFAIAPISFIGLTILLIVARKRFNFSQFFIVGCLLTTIGMPLALLTNTDNVFFALAGCLLLLILSRFIKRPLR